MLERLGYALGWAGDLLVVLALIGTLVLYINVSNDPVTVVSQPKLPLWVALGGCIIALVIFLIGRALRHMFPGND
jgi:hypothetical protein